MTFGEIPMYPLACNSFFEVIYISVSAEREVTEPETAAGIRLGKSISLTLRLGIVMDVVLRQVL